MEGRAVRFHELSSDRIKPVCRHFGECGGCKWQHLPYELQLRYKEAQVMDNLRRIGKTDIPDNMPIIVQRKLSCTGISLNIHFQTNVGLHGRK
jgi:23S rRNA (uracil1939-C5)-methyltransferase